MRKTRAVFIAVFLLSICAGLSFSAYAGTNHSQSEAVSWISARKAEHWAVDYDHTGGYAQCVDLIEYYFDYLAGYHLTGNGYDYVGRGDLPTGWFYTSTPSPGDIAVWAAWKGIAREWGHVALVESVGAGTFSYVDVNGGNGTGGSGTLSNADPSSFIHPDFGDEGAVHYGACNVDFDTIQHADIGYNNAKISAWMRNPSGYSMKSYGFYFGTNPNSMELFTIGTNVQWTDAFVSANVEDYAGTLSPGTTYYYRFYSLTDGFQLSGIRSFITSGSRAVSFDSLTNDNGNNRITAWFRNHYPCHIKSYGFQIGTSKNNLSDYIVVNRDVEWTDFFVDVILSDYLSDLVENQTYYYRFFALTDGFDFSEFGSVTIGKHIHSMTKHSSVSVTCLTDGRSEYYSCSKCNKYYSDAKGNTEIANNSWIIKATGHQHTEIRNKKAATCSEAGYTGDTYCKDCGVKIASGSSIQQQEHTWNQGEIIKAPTTNSEGTITYTCAVCGATRQESVAQLSEEQPGGGSQTGGNSQQSNENQTVTSASSANKKEPITIEKTPASVKGKAKKGKVTVSWKKIKKTKKTKALLKQIKGIQIQYSTDPKFENKAATKIKQVGKKKTKVTLKLKRKTKYYIRVRYVGADGVSKWSKVKKVKTK